MKQSVESTKMLIIALIFECPSRLWHPHLLRSDLFVVSARARRAKEEQRLGGGPLPRASACRGAEASPEGHGVGLSHSGSESGPKGELTGPTA